MFNDDNQFDPKGGQSEISQMLEEGSKLDLTLKEYLDLKNYQQDSTLLQQTTAQIFDFSRTITLN